jgi:hypothetical protein
MRRFRVCLTDGKASDTRLNLRNRWPIVATAVLWGLVGLLAREAGGEITFNLNFEGASLGKIERLSDREFHCHVLGQQDERGRNRQATWYYFRMDGARGKDVTLTLTDLVGEYHDKPGACAMGPDIVPVFSDDGHSWKHFPAIEWDAEKKEATLRFRPQRD